MTEREKLIDELAAVMAEHITAARSHGYAVDVAVAARAQVTTLEAAGVRLVPVEATGEMVEAAYSRVPDSGTTKNPARRNHARQTGLPSLVGLGALPRVSPWNMGEECGVRWAG